MVGSSVARKLLFFRDFSALTGGHLKVWHYFEHTRFSRDYQPAVYLTPESRRDASNPWVAHGARIEPQWRPDEADAYFVGGMDWQAIDRLGGLPDSVPVVNIIQGMRHADPANPRYRFLARRAVRICVNPMIENTLRQTPALRGPLFTVPIGLDVPTNERTVASTAAPVLITAYKSPELGLLLAERLRLQGIGVRVLTQALPREIYLGLVSEAQALVCLPMAVEGFYLTALEAMAIGTPVICPDCVGNRVYLRDGVNGFMPAYAPASILASINRAATLSPAEHRAVIEQAKATAAQYDPMIERQGFLQLLNQLDTLWRS